MDRVNPLSGVVGIAAGYAHTVYLQGTAQSGRRVIMIMANWGRYQQSKNQPGAGGGWIGQSAERGGGDLRG